MLAARNYITISEYADSITIEGWRNTEQRRTLLEKINEYREY